MAHTLELQAIDSLTHDTYRLVFEKPSGYAYEPGQATELTLQRDGLRDESRPFTFTSQPEDDALEFVIKSYPDHEGGVTKHIPSLEPGETVEIGDAWGAISDRGPGVFIAGGAGITPFIPILRRRAREGSLAGCTLVFSNKTEKDIILRDEWERMDGLDLWLLVTSEDSSPLAHRRLDRDALRERFPDAKSLRYYLCGPMPMVKGLTEALEDLGASTDSLVFEK